MSPRARPAETGRGAEPADIERPTRERLLAAAEALVDEGGYAAASVVAIAERAGVAAGTLYRHFPSKAELFVELFRTVCDREVAAMRTAAQAMAPSANETERLVTVLATFAQRALRRPRRAWALIAEPVDPLVDAERLEYRARYSAMIAQSLQAAIAAGELPEQDVAFTAAALVGGCGEALVGPLSPLAAGAPSIEPVLAAQRAFVLGAIGAEVPR